MTTTLSLEQAFALSVQHQQAGRPAEAEALLRRILQAVPEHPFALHHLGVALHQLGRGDEGVPFIVRSLALQPGAAEWHVNAATVLADLKRRDEAAEHLRRALAFKPDLAVARERLADLERPVAAAPAAPPPPGIPLVPELAALCRQAFSRPRRHDLVVFVANNPFGRVAKAALALRAQGISTVLLHHQPPKFNAARYFVETHAYRSPQEAVALACRYAPLAYHLFVSWEHVTPAFFIRHRPGPVVFDDYDVLAGILQPTHPAAAVIPLERFSLENADGLCCRSLEAQVAKRHLGYRLKGPSLLFLDGCWNRSDLPERPRRDPAEIHIAYCGNFGVEKLAANDATAIHLGLARQWATQRIHYHLYPAPMGQQTAFEEVYSDYLALEAATPYFHLHRPVPAERLLEELSQYDYGIHLSSRKLDTLADDAYNEHKHPYCTTNKLFDYFDAGLPVLGPSTGFISFVANRYGAGVMLTPAHLPRLRRFLEALSHENLRRRALETRARYAVAAHGGRLARFYEKVAASALP
ncbi:hypothetical protein [Azospirillum sp.]|uniref:hypothetical protein n=1 Tax=Azospirillum sp. TaxID=34012 RepID=UPI002D4EF8C6|nr:hypothetical protein [Azospirillum sp.]HYD70498.1 hypothetical protein [Azospirillum sp.]